MQKRRRSKRHHLTQYRCDLITSANHEAGHHVANWARYRIDGKSEVIRKVWRRDHSSTWGRYWAPEMGPVTALAGMVAEGLLHPFRSHSETQRFAAIVAYYFDHLHVDNPVYGSATKWLTHNRRKIKSRLFAKAKSVVCFPSPSDVEGLDRSPDAIAELLTTAVDVLQANMPQLIWVRNRLIERGAVCIGELPYFERESGLALSPLWITEAGPAPWHRKEIETGRIIEHVIH